jgi:hypothetical protein
MKSPAAIILRSDSVVGEVGKADGVMPGVEACVAVDTCVSTPVGLGVNVYVGPAVGIEVVVDVRVDWFTGVAVAVDIDALVVITNWGAKPVMPSLEE